MKRLDLTLATSRTYIPCQFQSCAITLLGFCDLRIMHACTLKMLNKKKNRYALFVNISFYPIISLMLAVVLYYIYAVL